MFDVVQYSSIVVANASNVPFTKKYVRHGLRIFGECQNCFVWHSEESLLRSTQWQRDIAWCEELIIDMATRQFRELKSDNELEDFEDF